MLVLCYLFMAGFTDMIALKNIGKMLYGDVMIEKGSFPQAFTTHHKD